MYFGQKGEKLKSTNYHKQQALTTELDQIDVMSKTLNNSATQNLTTLKKAG